MMLRLTLALIGFATVLASANNNHNHPANPNVAVVTRDAPSLEDDARIKGSVRQLRGQNVTIGKEVAIYGDYLVPGAPRLRVDDEAHFRGVRPGNGSAQPNDFRVTIEEDARLRYLRTRTDPTPLTSVATPPQPSGTRNVTIYRRGQSVGNFATLKNLTLKRSAGFVSVPPGTYGKFKVSDRNNGLILGVAGAATPVEYNLQDLELGSRTQLKVVSPVILKVANGFTLRGILGTSGKPERLEVRIARGYLSLHHGSCIYGAVRIPGGEVRMDSALIVGNVHCRRLDMEDGLIEWASAGFDGTANRAPVADGQEITLDEDSSAAITLTGSDPDGDDITFMVTDGPDHGTLTGTAPNLTYQPNADYHGFDAFRFKVNDGQLDSTTATISLRIRRVPDFPVETNKAVIVRHAPVLQGGSKVKGSMQQLLGEDVSLSGGTWIFGDYCAPGTPLVTVNGHPVFQGVLPGSGSPLPDNYSFTIGGHAKLRYLRSKTDPVTLASVAAPPGPTGTRKVTITRSSQSPGDFSTLKDLRVRWRGGMVAVPPGTYGKFSASGRRNGFIFGSADDSTPAVYNLQELELDTGTQLKVAGPVILTVAQGFSLKGILGNTDNPELLEVRIADGHLKLWPLSCIYGAVRIPDDKVWMQGPSLIVGNVHSDRLRMHGHAFIKWAQAGFDGDPGNQPPVAVSQSISLDEDTSSSLTLIGNDPDGDPLAFTLQSGPANGAISGTAPNLVYTPNANFAGADAFTFVVNDGEFDSAPATISLTVNPINDLPVAADQSIAMQEDVAVAVTLAATDIENDPLTFAIQSGPANGSLTGAAPNLIYTPAPNFFGSDSFTFTANDGGGDSAAATVSIAVTPVNDSPIAQAQSVATAEDTATPVILTGNDVEGSPLSYTLIDAPVNGSLSGAAPNLTYTPNTDYAGSDSFTFRVNDGVLDSAPATVSINVAPVNDPPVANAQSLTFSEDTPQAILLTGSDVEGSPLTFTVVIAPTNGVISGTAPNLTYTPNADFHGSDHFTFKINDGELDSPSVTVDLTITPVNDAPVAENLSVNVNEDANQSVTLAGSDVESSPLTFTIITGPSNGALSGTAPDLTYIPNADYFGADSFTYRVNDGDLDSAVATATITVAPINDAPTAASDAVFTAEDTPTAITLIGNDIEGSALTYTVTAVPANGALSGTPPNLTYTPAPNFFGSDAVTYIVNDGELDSTPATITLTVTPVNDTPVAAAVSVTTPEDTAASVTLVGSDIDGDALTYAVLTSPSHGVLSGTASNLTYTPAPDYFGTDSFTYQVNDGSVDSPAATVSITITPVNDAPVAGGQTVTLAEDASVPITLSGIDTENDPLTFSVVTAPANGALSGAVPNLVYTPNADYFGADSFTFKANDGLADSAPAAIAITVTPVNDAPVAADQSLNGTEDTSLNITLTASDADGDGLTSSIQTPPANGVLSTSGSTLSYSPNANYFGPDQFTFLVNDGQVDSAPATVTLNIAPVNDEPSFALRGRRSLYALSSGFHESISLREINPENGNVLSVMPVTTDLAPDWTIDSGTGLAVNPVTGDLYAILVLVEVATGTAFYENRSLVRMDPVTGASTFLFDTGGSVVSIAFGSDGTLYGLTGPNAGGTLAPLSVFKFDLVTGAATFVATVSNAAGSHAIGFNPDDGLIYHSTGDDDGIAPASGIWETIDPVSGTVTFVTNSLLWGKSLVYAGDGDFYYTASEPGLVSRFGRLSASSATPAPVIAYTNFFPRGLALSASGNGRDTILAVKNHGPVVIRDWVFDFNPGPNETSQTLLSKSLGNLSDPTLFSTIPALDANGNLTFTPAADATGVATLDVAVQDDGGTANGGDDDAVRSVTISIVKVNEPPTFDSPSPDALVGMGNGPFVQYLDPATGATRHTLALNLPGHVIEGANGLAAHPTTGETWAILRLDGDSVNRWLARIDSTLTVHLIGQLGAPFASMAFDASGNLFAVKGNDGANANSLFSVDTATAQATFLVQLPFGGGHALGFNPDNGLLYHHSAGIFSSIHPTTLAITPIAVPGLGFIGDARAMTYAGSNEFLLSGYNGVNEFWRLATNGTRTFLGDLFQFNKGLAFPVAVPPVFEVFEDAGPQSIASAASNFSPGPPDETGQALLGYEISNVINPGLFTAGPVVDNSGALQFTAADNAHGLAIFTVRARDDGGVAFGGNDLSSPATWAIAIFSVNDAPTFTLSDLPVVDEDAGPQTVVDWVTDITAGAGETDLVGFEIVNLSPAGFFSAPPTLSAISGGAAALSYTVAPDQSGTATFDIRAVDNGGTANGGVDATPFRTATLTVNPINDPPTSYAGEDSTVEFPNQAILFGIVGDDGDPPSEPLIHAWSQVSGPGSVLIPGGDQLAATASFTASGIYELALSVSDGALAANDTVTITVTPAGGPQAPTADAGTDLTISQTDTITLTGQAADDGFPTGNLTATWSQLSGPGTAAIANPTVNAQSAGNGAIQVAAATSLTFPVDGVYTLRLTVSDGQSTTTDDIAVTVYLDNQPPTVNAGADQTVNSPTIGLEGLVTDDNLPTNSTLTVGWTKVSGPGAVVFADPNSARTSATIDAVGTYVLRLSAADGELNATDDVTVEVTSVNTAPVVDAGSDQSLDLTAGGAIPNLPPTVLNIPTPVDQWINDLGGTGGLANAPGQNPGTVGRNSMGLLNGHDLIVGGAFFSANGDPGVYRVAKWACGDWSVVDPAGQLSPAVNLAELAALDGEIFLEQFFETPTTETSFIRFNGTHWTNWGPNILDNTVDFRDLHASTDAVYIGGVDAFQPVDWDDPNILSEGSPILDANNQPDPPVSRSIVKWSPTTGWEGLGGGVFDTNVTSPFNPYKVGVVNDIATDNNGNVYVGGAFNRAGDVDALNIARWDGSAWHALGGPMSGCDGFRCASSVTSVAVDPASGDLYISGNFKNIDGMPVNYFARWDGSGWHEVGGGIAQFGNSTTVNDMAFYRGDLYIGGAFLNVDPAGANLRVNYIARWDGTNWSQVVSPGGASVGVDNRVMAFEVSPTGIYVGGLFDTAGGLPATRIAKWGYHELPTLNPPDPVFVDNAAPTGAQVTLNADAGHRCDTALSVRWHVNGVEEQVDNLPAGSTAPFASVPFVHDYPIGQHTVTITVENGLADPVSATTTVLVVAPGATSLTGAVTDDGLPTGSTLTHSWALVEGDPANVNIATSTALTTLATFTQAGTYTFALTGDDGELSTVDEVTVVVHDVGPINQAPTVLAGPDHTLNLGEPLNLSGTYSDDGVDSDSLTTTWSQISGPGTATFTAPTESVTGQTGIINGTHSTGVSFDKGGAYVLRFAADDTHLNSQDEITVTVIDNGNAPPTADAGPDATLIVTDTLLIPYTAEDDGLPIGVINASWSKVSGPGEVLIFNRNGVNHARFSTEGAYVLRLTVSDTALSATDEITVTVYPDAPEPGVSFNNIGDGEIITSPTSLRGAVVGDLVDSWELKYRRIEATGTAPWITLATGDTEVPVVSTLGTFDPTLLLNGPYEMQLAVTDLVGRTVSTEPFEVIVEGNMKVGKFEYSTLDLELELSGVPIQIIRYYDSFDTENGDFGTGWTLKVNNIRVHRFQGIATGWTSTSTGGELPIYGLTPDRPKRVFVVFPDNRLEKFEAKADPSIQSYVPIRSPNIAFTPVGNTYGSLSPILDDGVFAVGSLAGPVELINIATVDPFNPTLWRYISPRGDEYVIDELDGLKSLKDRNGNTLTITETGITHSSGKSVSFVRDGMGRITSIIDPSNNVLQYEYNARGDLTRVVDRDGLETTLSFDSDHKLLTIIDESGNTLLENQFDASGRLVGQKDGNGASYGVAHDLGSFTERVTDRLGKVTTHKYDSRGNIIETTDPLQNKTTYTFDLEDNMLSRTDPAGNTTSWTYDNRKNITSVIDAAGYTNTFSYGSFGELTSHTDPLGQTSSWEYDQFGNLTRQTDPTGAAVTFEYDAGGNNTRIVDGNGDALEYEYGPGGSLARVDVVDSTYGLLSRTDLTVDDRLNTTGETLFVDMPGGQVALTTTYEYDNEGNPTRIVGPDGKDVMFALDQHGNVTGLTDRLNQTASFGYDGNGLIASATFPDAGPVHLGYDGKDRITSFSSDGNVSYAGAHDDAGRLASFALGGRPAVLLTRDPAGRVTGQDSLSSGLETIQYDPRGLVTSVVNDLGDTITKTFDAGNRLATFVNQLGDTTQYFRDQKGRLTQTLLPSGASRFLNYDALDNVVSRQDENGLTTSFDYDAFGRLRKITDPLQQIHTYHYDSRDELVERIDALGRSTEFVIDDLLGTTVEKWPSGAEVQTTLDDIGNVVSKTMPDGKVTTRTYDALRRPLTVAPDPGLGETGVTYQYDAQGRVDSVADASGMTEFEYDAFGNVTRVVAPAGTLNYEYDAAARVVRMHSSNVNGIDVGYAYDAIGRLEYVTNSYSGVTQYVYNKLSQIEEVRYPSGVWQKYFYNEDTHLVSIEVRDAADALMEAWSYNLDAAGRMLMETNAQGREVTYDYDAGYRLIRESVTGAPSGANGVLNYDYDAVGNRTSRASTIAGIDNQTFSYNVDDELTAYAHDANGAAVEFSRGGPGAGTVHIDSYDFRGRLLSRDSGAVQLTHDAFGNLARKTAGGSTTEYLVDLFSPSGYAQTVEEITDGVVTKTFTYGAALIGMDFVVSPPGGSVWGSRYYSADALGNVRMLTDENGAMSDSYEYEAFGTVIHQTGNSPNSHLHKGERFDSDLGLYYLRARYYDPYIGRFRTRDPFEGMLEQPMSLNKYLYCDADPVNNWDPSGNLSITELKMVVKTQIRVARLAVKKGHKFLKKSAANYYRRVFKRGSKNKPPRGWANRWAKSRMTQFELMLFWRMAGGVNHKSRRLGIHSYLSRHTRSGYQSHHINQNAAFGSKVPRSFAVTIELRGARRPKGGGTSEHQRYHDYVDDFFWKTSASAGAKMGDYQEYSAEGFVRAGLTREVPATIALGMTQLYKFGIFRESPIPGRPGI